MECARRPPQKASRKGGFLCLRREKLTAKFL
jgi:hypothetical protein